MNYEKAKRTCHVRSAIYRKSAKKRYWKNHPDSLDSRVPDADKAATDWEEYDPRDSDEGSLYMFND